jgi:hypothetical protein
MSSYYVVSGFKRRFNKVEDAEYFRLSQVKRTGRTDLRIEKVFPGRVKAQTHLISLKKRATPKPI